MDVCYQKTVLFCWGRLVEDIYLVDILSKAHPLPVTSQHLLEFGLQLYTIANVILISVA